MNSQRYFLLFDCSDFNLLWQFNKSTWNRNLFFDILHSHSMTVSEITLFCQSVLCPSSATWVPFHHHPSVLVHIIIVRRPCAFKALPSQSIPHPLSKILFFSVHGVCTRPSLINLDDCFGGSKSKSRMFVWYCNTKHNKCLPPFSVNVSDRQSLAAIVCKHHENVFWDDKNGMWCNPPGSLLPFCILPLPEADFVQLGEQGVRDVLLIAILCP